MTVISKHSAVPYQASEMFALVDDVASYPEFLPWCNATAVLYRSEDEVRATIEIAHAAFHKSFSILHRMQNNKMIEMRLVEGPFKHFEGFWRFEPIADGCKVYFELEFRFSSKLLGLAAGPLFGQIANSLVDAFTQRAAQIYGSR
jgi:ribosome-associated toxin RatA of RatAB toxin-antitoxin module